MAVRISIDADIAELRLDWPETRNALGPDQGRQLQDALDQAVAADVGAIVISAEGKAFCAGGDLPEIVRLAALGPEAVKATVYGVFQGLFRTIAEAPMPIIAAVEGPAIGLGCDLAIGADVTFMGPKAWLAQGWIRAGLIPATGGVRHVVRRAGQQTLWRLAVADKVDAAEADHLGLAIATPDARASALEMAGKLSALPRAAIRAMRALSFIEPLDEHMDAAVAYQVGFLTHPDFADRSRRLLGQTAADRFAKADAGISPAD